MPAFETCKTYTTRSIGDSDCVISVTIEARTAKTVTGVVMGNVKTFRVSVRDGVESFKPWGSYSMAPTIRSA